MSKKRAPATRPPVKTVVCEGFGLGCATSVSMPYLSKAPDFVNFISIHRIRVTVEVLEEPVEVLAARLRELWETLPRNCHHNNTFKKLSLEYGVQLPPETRATRAPSRAPRPEPSVERLLAMSPAAFLEHEMLKT